MERNVELHRVRKKRRVRRVPIVNARGAKRSPLLLEAYYAGSG